MAELKFKKYLVLTKILVGISIVGSLCSYYTIEKGFGEVYPFYTYKLFSQPRGSNNSVVKYRIYYRNEGQKKIIRSPIQATSSFSKEQYFYTLNYFVDKTIQEGISTSDYRDRLFVLVKHLVPDKAEYKIVEEKCHPENLLLKKVNYDTTTVISF